MQAKEALQEALQALEIRAAETDTASPPEGHRVRLAIEVIEALLEQKALPEPLGGPP